MSRSKNKGCGGACGLCRRPEKEVRRAEAEAALKQAEQEDTEVPYMKYDAWAASAADHGMDCDCFDCELPVD